MPGLGKRYENTVNDGNHLALLTGSVEADAKTRRHPAPNPQPLTTKTLPRGGRTTPAETKDYYLAELRHYICGVNLAVDD